MLDKLIPSWLGFLSREEGERRERRQANLVESSESRLTQ